MTIIVRIAFASVLAVAGKEFSVDDTVAAHDGAVGLIHTADIYLETSRNLSGEVMERLRWSLAGSRERVRSEELQLGKDLRRFSDSYVDGRTLCYLLGVDPSNPPHAKSPLDLQGVHASRRAETRHQMTMRAADFLLLRPTLTADDEKRTLKELVHDSRAAFGADAAQLIGHETVDGHDTIHIRILHPGVTDEATDKTKYRGSHIDVFLDPAVNFHIRRTESHANAEPPRHGWVTVRHANRLNDYGNGVFLAADTVSEVSSETGETDSKHATRVVITKGIVNEPLPLDALDFQWPVNSMVVELPPTNGVSNVELMGPNNVVQKTIHNSDEMRKLMGSLVKAKATPDPDKWPWGYILLCGTLLVGALALLVLRFRLLMRRHN